MRIEIYDTQGRRVRILVNGVVPAGYHRVSWDGRSGQGRPVPSGVYFARFEAGRFGQSTPITVLR